MVVPTIPSLPGADFNGVAPRLLKTAKGRIVFHQGDPAKAIYRVVSGCLRLQLESNGRRRVISFLFPDDLFCAGFNVCWASAHAITDSVVAAYPLDRVSDAAARDPGAAMTLLAAVDKLLSELARQLVLTHASADLRLEWFLDWLSERGGLDGGSDTLALPMSRHDIADHLGVARETVSRALNRLEKRGELQRDLRHTRKIVRRPREPK